MDPTQGTNPPPVMGVAAFLPAGTMPYQYQQLYQQEDQHQLQSFWNEQYEEIQNTSEFKNHSLPLARVKKIMKADEDVKMIAAEAPVVLARACEMFILELTHRSWAHVEENKKRTLQKNDIAAAIIRTDLFDFLVDIVPREEGKEDMFGLAAAGILLNPSYHMQHYYTSRPERGMEISTEIRDWSELIPDALGIIFKHLSLEEKLTVVPSVCKSWRRVVCSPNCWEEIDLELFSKSCTREKLDRLLRMLIIRSCGSFSKFAVYGLCTDALFSFVANNAGSLQTLIIPGNDISDSIVEEVACRLTNVTTLDLSFSVKIGPKALEAFGKNCRNLTVLRYSNNARPMDSKSNQDDEAFAVSSTMPNLRHLEVTSLLLTGVGVSEILSKCTKLELLNIKGCWNVEVDQKVLEEKYPNVKVLFGQHDDSSDEEYDYQYFQYDIFDGDSDPDPDPEYYILDAYGLL